MLEHLILLYLYTFNQAVMQCREKYDSYYNCEGWMQRVISLISTGSEEGAIWEVQSLEAAMVEILMVLVVVDGVDQVAVAVVEEVVVEDSVVRAEAEVGVVTLE